MFSSFDWTVFLPGLILLIASIDDLRSRKIHNKLILFLLPFVLIAVALLKGLGGLFSGAISALLAVIVGVPLTLARVIGGGDLKLLVLLALTVDWFTLIDIFVYSLPWALLLGLFKMALDRKIKNFFFNLVFLFKQRGAQGLKLHSIPFSFTLFMGWLSFLTLKGLNYSFVESF